MSAAAHAHGEHEHHGPPVPHYSSRIKPETLGMYLFIASEIMLFGSFFTAYFFVRIVNGTPWPTPPYHLPVFVATVNTFILMTSSATMHWATVSIKRGNVWGMRAGMLLTFLMGLAFLTSQLFEYMRA
ncbi:MAG TPA: cytochrome c oxidase subunit 3, partial [Gaiellaceae bacterium]|nr:cytochrome c oxidase subunit 3 [Gaiellaceae bacterium]